MCVGTPAAAAASVEHARTQSSDDLSPKRRKRPWRAVALDNDETTGSWGRASLLYRLWVNVVGRKPDASQFVDHYLAHGGARPGLAKMLQELALLKQNCLIDEVVMFTSASNKDGWVSFLKECLEMYADTPGLFGRVLSMQDDSIRASNGRMLKDLSLISPDPFDVVLIDDKPEYAWKGYVVGVPEYCANVPIDRLVAQLANEVPSLDSRSEIAYVLKRDNEMHPPSTVDYSADKWLARVLPAVKRLFTKSKPPASESLNLDVDELSCKRVKTIEAQQDTTTHEVTVRT